MPNPEKQLAEGYTLALNFVVSTIIGMAMGLALDKWLGTMPIFLLIFMVLGFSAGLRKMMQAANRAVKGE